MRWVAALAVVLAFAGCGGGGRHDSAFVLLRSATLLRVDVETGRVEWRRRLAPAPWFQPGLVRGRDGALWAFGARTLVAVSPDGEVVRLIRLPRSFVPEALAAGPRSGTTYLVGGAGRGRVEVDAVDGVRLRRVALVRRSPRRDWIVSAAAIAPDESELALSYHGSSTTGVDLVDLETRRPKPCRTPPRYPGNACIRAHGGVWFAGARIVSTTGGEEVDVRREDGSLVRMLRSRLPGNHLVDLALDAHGHAYAAGACFYAGGLSRLDLAGGPTRVLAPEHGRVCGSALAVTRGGLVLISSFSRYARNEPGTLLVVDGRGEIRRRLETATYPVAAVAP